MQFVYFCIVWLHDLLLNTAASRDFPRRLAVSYSKLDSAKAVTETGHTQAASRQWQLSPSCSALLTPVVSEPKPLAAVPVVLNINLFSAKVFIHS